MKTMLLLFLLLSPLARAEPLEDPCQGLGCTPAMEAISQEFRSGSRPEQFPLLASGECYHHSSLYDGNRAHHGFAFLDPSEGSLYMSASFAFFFDSNPYGTITAEEARQRDPKLYSENRRVTLAPDHLYVDMNAQDPTNPWKFWLKQNARGETLLIGQWGFQQRLFCRFLPNP